MAPIEVREFPFETPPWRSSGHRWDSVKPTVEEAVAIGDLPIS
jgi:hypothetical protein